ncbi:MAG: hypothetical protein QF464_20120, partial [Myxococcota bacterium]|nr:hypothetical protein [Myxococcota bacterium]
MESEVCDQCMADFGCAPEAIDPCLAVSCGADDAIGLTGTCPEDCPVVGDGPSECGDNTCSPDEAPVDADMLAGMCTSICPGDIDCAAECMVNESGLSTGCATCMAAGMACVFTECAAECMDDQSADEEACQACVADKGCMAEDYMTCIQSECTPADDDALASSCPEDCGSGGCLAGQAEGCDGGCYDGDSIGDGVCDEGLNCEDWNYDDGDCLSAPCGDHICEPGEESACPSDCVVCGDDELASCWGTCRPVFYYGNGECDSDFDCEALSFDGGDCGDSCGDGLCTGNESPIDMGPVSGTCMITCESDPECTAQCIADEGMTLECAGCFGDAVLCVSDMCDEECFVLDDPAACDSCATTYCYEEDFLACKNASCANETDELAFSGSCPMDCGECSASEIWDCGGECAPADWLGD